MNLDPLCQPGDTSKIQVDLTKLDNIVDHNEAEEVLAIDVLDFFPLQVRMQVLNDWKAKVAHGGTITLSCMDVNEVSRLINLGELDNIQTINSLIFGDCRSMWAMRKSVVPLDDTVAMLTMDKQFDITGIKFESVFYIITAKRR
jgi:hypothetical protein